MTDQDAPQDQPQPRPRRPLVALGVTLAVVAVVAAGLLLSRPHSTDTNSVAAMPGAPASQVATEPAPPAAVPETTKKDRKHSVPGLVPGSPLDDDKFAQISAEIVIAAMGLKKDKQWESNLLLYMQKTVDKHGVTIEQYNTYARALYDHPDRGRAVAENIMTRVERKIGTRVSLDKLPMFRFDEKTIKQLQKRLEE